MLQDFVHRKNPFINIVTVQKITTHHMLVTFVHIPCIQYVDFIAWMPNILNVPFDSFDSPVSLTFKHLIDSEMLQQVMHTETVFV